MAPISLYCAAVIWKKVPFPMGLPRWLSGKEFTWQCRRHRRHGFDPWVKKIPWSRKWQPTTVFLPGRFHGQRSLVGYSPWFHKESDTTEGLNRQACHSARRFLSICFVRRAYTCATCWTTGVKFANRPVCRWGSLLAWRWLACPTATCLVSREPHIATDTLGLSETSLDLGVLSLSSTDIWGLDHPLQ